MQELKQVKSRLIFFEGVTPNGKEHMDVVGTFNVTQRDFKNRNPDFEVEIAEGERFLIDKSLIAAIREIKVVFQKAEEVNQPRKTI